MLPERMEASVAIMRACGWATFMAQRAQAEHEQRHLQIAEQMASDHFVRVIRDPEGHQLPGVEQQLAPCRDHQAHRTDEARSD